MKKILGLTTILSLTFFLTFSVIGHAQLLEAVIGNDLQMVQELLVNGADPNQSLEDGLPLLLVAIITDAEPTLLDLLLDSGADPNWADEDGLSILTYTILVDGSIAAVKSLINHGVDINAKNSDGFNALMFASVSCEDEAMLHLLLDAGANPALTSDDGDIILSLIEENPKLRNTSVHQRIQATILNQSSLAFSFPEVLVPKATCFPINFQDETTSETYGPFFLATYETTYALWKEVYDWATSPDRGTKRYYFWYEGTMGAAGRGSTTPEHPVTLMTWFDAVNWCNALTEYYNMRNGTDLECVYYNKGVLCRDSRQESIYQTMHEVEPLLGHRGFRLPTSEEWDLAARYQDGVTWTPSKYISGGLDIYDPRVEDYVWYMYNSDKITNPVGQKLPNALGIYDMSGNVSEFCFVYPDTIEPGDWRVDRGGDFVGGLADMWVGSRSRVWPGTAFQTKGFRIARDY